MDVALPKLLFVGHSRSGKGEAGLWFDSCTNCSYAGSTSALHVDDIAKELGVSPKRAWEERHSNRAYWRQWYDNYRIKDPSALVRESFLKGNIAEGTRARCEMDAVARYQLADLVIWVDRDGLLDPTLEFGPEVADFVINNNGTLEDYHCRLRRLASTLRGVVLTA